MPIQNGKDNISCYAQWGDHGAKYHYECGNEEARKNAENKAFKQGQAIIARGAYYKNKLKKK